MHGNFLLFKLLSPGLCGYLQLGVERVSEVTERETERGRERIGRQWRGINSNSANVPCGNNSDFGYRQEATVLIIGRYKHSSFGFFSAESINLGRREWQ